jgi:rhodanese-related sulfurtransferase
VVRLTTLFVAQITDLRKYQSELAPNTPANKVNQIEQAMTSAALPIEINVQQVQELQQAKDEFLFLDCRETAEYGIAKIEGTQLIPMNEIPSRLEELEIHRDKRIVVHCHHGGRSMQVTQYLRQQGFEKTQNMAGGIDVWSQEIDASIPRY